MSKVDTAIWSVSATCFGVASVASAWGGASPYDKYTNTSKWHDMGHEKKVEHKSGGYDNQKHGDKKHGDKKVDFASWRSDDSHDSDDRYSVHDYSWSEDSHENNWSDESWSDDDSGHSYGDSDGWSSDMGHKVGEWGNWSPDSWRDAGHSYDKWAGDFGGYMSGFNWNGGSDDKSPVWGDGWQHDWNSWNPKSWKDAGSSYENWRAQMVTHVSNCQDDWQEHEDSGHEDRSYDVTHSDYSKDDYSKDDSEHHDYASGQHYEGSYDDGEDEQYDDSKQESVEESEDHSWSESDYDHDEDRDEDSDYESDYEHWGGSVKDDNGYEVAYKVRD